jgi:acetyl esterase/lipase
MKDPSDRRTFLRYLAVGTATSALPISAFAQEENVRKRTYTYKTVESCEIKADVYGASDTTRPVVMWIHGGALIMGSRGPMDKALLAKLLKAGYAVVSIDYRLAPETKLPAILEDLQDACKWVREKGPELSESSGKNNRHRFYLYCRQQGLWPKEVSGHDPDKEPKAFDALCPVRNVSANYPPTLLIHGTKDTDVPYEQSAMMAKELNRKGVEHELITVQDAGHGLAGAKPSVVAETQDRVLAFLNKHMQ